MRSSSTSRVGGSSSRRGLGSGVGVGVGELILSGEELTSLFDACATDCLGRYIINTMSVLIIPYHYLSSQFSPFVNPLSHSLTHTSPNPIYLYLSLVYLFCLYINRGRINPSETWRHDARYSQGKALHINDFADRLNQVTTTYITLVSSHTL